MSAAGSLIFVDDIIASFSRFLPDGTIDSHFTFISFITHPAIRPSFPSADFSYKLHWLPFSRTGSILQTSSEERKRLGFFLLPPFHPGSAEKRGNKKEKKRKKDPCKPSHTRRIHKLRLTLIPLWLSSSRSDVTGCDRPQRRWWTGACAISPLLSPTPHQRRKQRLQSPVHLLRPDYRELSTGLSRHWHSVSPDVRDYFYFYWQCCTTTIASMIAVWPAVSIIHVNHLEAQKCTC